MVRCARIRPEFLPKNDHARGTGRHCLGFETMAARRDCRRTRSGELDGVMTPSVSLGIGPVSFPDLVAVARDGAAVSLDAEAVTALERARAVVDELAAAPTPAYGISTGFGALATRHIPTDMRAQLQR